MIEFRISQSHYQVISWDIVTGICQTGHASQWKNKDRPKQPSQLRCISGFDWHLIDGFSPLLRGNTRLYSHSIHDHELFTTASEFTTLFPGGLVEALAEYTLSSWLKEPWWIGIILPQDISLEFCISFLVSRSTWLYICCTNGAYANLTVLKGSKPLCIQSQLRNISNPKLSNGNLLISQTISSSDIKYT